MAEREIDPSQITENTPLSLAKAAELAFPDGRMKASSLRYEAAKGRLVIERIAGKDYTTLAYIARMRELCRQQPKAPGYGSGPRAESGNPSGSSATDRNSAALAAALMILDKPSKNSRNTSPRDTGNSSALDAAMTAAKRLAKGSPADRKRLSHQGDDT